MKCTLIDLAKQIFDVNITDIYIMTANGKWYEQKFEKTSEIVCGNNYGVSIDGAILFNFKAAKNEDNIVKSFISQFISKHEIGKRVLFNGQIVTQTRDIITERLNKRLKNGLFYSTNYGIGFFCFFHSEQALNNCSIKMDDYLKNINVSYSNEFSEARWVYRWVLTNGNKPNNTAILSNFID